MGRLYIMDWLQYHDEPITLHSGQASNWFIDGDLIFDNLDLRGAVFAHWEKALKQSGLMYSSRGLRFYGVPTGGTKWAKAFVEYINPEGGGGIKWMKESTPGQILIDDVATTGASIAVHAGPKLVVVSRDSSIPVMAAWAEINL